MNIIIENDQYLIRSVTQTDKDAYMRVHQENSEMSKAYDEDNFRDYFWERGIMGEEDIYMMVIRKADQVHVANCSFQGITGEAVEIGLDVDIPFQNQGIGTTVLQMTVPYLQKVMPEKRILLKTYSTNLHCQKIAEKTGGVKVGEEPTELEIIMKKMIPLLEEQGLYEEVNQAKETLAMNEGVCVIVYEYMSRRDTN